MFKHFHLQSLIKSKLGLRIFLVMAMTAAIPLILFAAPMYFETRNVVVKETYSALEDYAKVSSRQIVQILSVAKAQLAHLSDGGTIDPGENYFQQVVRLKHDFTDQSGMIPGWAPSEADEIQLLDSGRVFLSAPFMLSDGTLTVAMIRRAEHGYLAGILNPNILWGNLTAQSAARTTGLHILNENGKVFFTTAPGTALLSEPGLSALAPLPDQNRLSGEAKLAGVGDAFWAYEQLWLGGLFITEPWGFLAFRENDAVLLLPSELSISLGGILILSLATIVFIAARTGHYLFDPIKNIQEKAEQLGAGDWSAQAPIKTDDELGRLAASFNTMAAKLKESHENLMELNFTLEERVKERTQDLSEATARYEAAVAGSNDGIWDWDLLTGTVYYSDKWKEMTGYSKNEHPFTIEDWLKLLSQPDRPAVREKLHAHLARESELFEVEERFSCLDGSHKWFLVRGKLAFDEHGDPVRMAGSFTDITKQKESEERAIHDSLHDPLTRLPNRALLEARIEQRIAECGRDRDAKFGVLFVDLDRFKEINDRFGHDVGDDILKGIGKRLLACIRPNDTVARIGGDEYVVFLREITGTREAEMIAARLHDSLAHPFEFNDQAIRGSFSIGITVGSRNYRTPQEAIKDADTAMYKAKISGKSRSAIFEAKT